MDKLKDASHNGVAVPRAVGMVSVVSFYLDSVDSGSKAGFLDGCQKSFTLLAARQPCKLIPRSSMIGFIAFIEHISPDSARDRASKEQVVVGFYLRVTK